MTAILLAAFTLAAIGLRAAWLAGNASARVAPQPPLPHRAIAAWCGNCDGRTALNVRGQCARCGSEGVSVVNPNLRAPWVLWDSERAEPVVLRRAKLEAVARRASLRRAAARRTAGLGGVR